MSRHELGRRQPGEGAAVAVQVRLVVVAVRGREVGQRDGVASSPMFNFPLYLVSTVTAATPGFGAG